MFTISIGDVLNPDWCDDPVTKFLWIFPAVNFFKLLGADDALATNLSMLFTIWLAIVIPMIMDSSFVLGYNPGHF